MSFEYTIDDVATEDFEGTECVTFVLKPVGQVPVGVIRRNRHDQEAQMWATLEWGLSGDQMEVFDRLTANQVSEMLIAWQASGEEAQTAEQDKPVSPPKTKKPATE